MSEKWCYFLCNKPSFWSLKEDAIEWQVIGGTLAVKEEVLELLRILDGNGVPRVNFLMLFLAAFKAGSEKIIPLFAESMDCDDDAVLGDWQGLWKTHCEMMLKLVETPPDIPMWKAFLCEQIFINQEGTCRAGAIAKLELNNGTVWRDESVNLDRSVARALLVHALRIVLSYRGPNTKRELELLYKTGTIAEPKLLEEVVPENSLAKLFFDLKQAGRESAVVAKLAELMYPAFAQKGKMQQSQDLPLGGYTDVSNKGSIDKLLMSELAHDDATLATRIVMGEAMYLKREAPPLPDQPVKAVILDCGVRSWGIPRLLVTAAAMALTRMKKEEIESVVFQNDYVGELERVTFLEAQDVLQQMGNLAATAHPGRALESYFDKDREANEDVYLITTTEVLEDREFKQYLQFITQEHDFYLMTVDRSGDVVLSYHTQFGVRNMWGISVDVMKLLEETVEKTVADTYKSDGQIPFALQEQSGVFPMRVPLKATNRKPRGVFAGGYIDRTKFNYLVYWEPGSSGGIVLDRSCRPGSIVYAHLDSGVIYAVFLNADGMLLAVSEFEEKASWVDLPEEIHGAKHFLIKDEMLFGVFDSKIVAVNRKGELCENKVFASKGYGHGYICGSNSSWCLIHYTDKINLIEKNASLNNRKIMYRDFRNRIVKVENGVLIVDTKKIRKSLLYENDFSAQGNFIEIEKTVGKRLVYDLENDKELMTSHPLDFITFNKNQGNMVPQIVKNFSYAGISRTGKLVIVTARGIPHVFHFASQLFKRQEKLWLEGQEMSYKVELKSLETPKNGMLSKACFDDVIDVYLDQHGFLHLVPLGRALPELMICLCVGKLSGAVVGEGSFGNQKLLYGEVMRKGRLEEVLYEYSELIASIFKI